ncbi:hypothetical protein TorRG33x02_127110 [Trema orientale]|uniref:Uncharacterized protein n=1 Tax=Trema orientale TaxID=63057 RepID=A0A2P5F0X7_TREOI|nr:hypothetical protein TorRG33x02_127110 [Trema orientale]
MSYRLLLEHQFQKELNLPLRVHRRLEKWRKRAVSMKDSRKVQCRCLGEKVCSVILTMNDEQKTAITKCGFRSFLCLRSPFMKSSLISYLTDRVDAKVKTLKIHKNTYLLNRETFESVMGLLDGGEEIITYDDMEVNPVRDEIVRADGRIVVTDLVVNL